ncbi:MAG: RraA family protein [Burkholderiales bacterium]|nr:RraA family protein [Burkholderiales bacterium]
MIEDPPLVTLRRPTRRPSPAQIEALKGVQTGFLVDAMGGRGALDHRIRVLAGLPADFCGVALTCHAGPCDNLAVFAMLPVLTGGDVMMVATDSYVATAVAGDLLLGMARNQGAAAFVTDGCVRDIPGLLGVGLPCFSAGVTPNSPARNGPGTVGLPVVVGGVAVETGDIVVGDIDGVVVVPFDRIDAVIARLPDIRRAEAALDAKVKAGLTVPDFARAIFEQGRVREVE